MFMFVDECVFLSDPSRASTVDFDAIVLPPACPVVMSVYVALSSPVQ